MSKVPPFDGTQNKCPIFKVYSSTSCGQGMKYLIQNVVMHKISSLFKTGAVRKFIHISTLSSECFCNILSFNYFWLFYTPLWIIYTQMDTLSIYNQKRKEYIFNKISKHYSTLASIYVAVPRADIKQQNSRHQGTHVETVASTSIQNKLVIIL